MAESNLITAAVLGASIISGAAIAEPDFEHINFIDGNTLLTVCSENKNKGNCYAYVAGFSDLYRYLDASNVSIPEDVRFCLPEHASLGQVRLVIEKYLRENPELLHYGAGNLVYDALFEAFPCKSGAK